MSDIRSDSQYPWYIDGPWVKRYNKYGQYEVVDRMGREIITISAYENDGAGDEASIISAAPEMLLILKNLLKCAGSDWNGFPVEDIASLVLKAEGMRD